MAKRTRMSTRITTLPAALYKPLPASTLRWQCDPKFLGIKTSDDIKPSRDIIGQERALRALRVGLEMTQFGYNIFVTGFSGTGRTTTIKRMLQEFEKRPGVVKDHCYVHNFKNPDMPVAIRLPAGQGNSFKDEMVTFLEDLKRDIPSAYESQRYQQARRLTVQHFQDRQRSVLQEYERRVKERGFELVQVQSGTTTRPEIMPVFNGQPVAMDQIEAFVQKGEVPKADGERFRSDLLELEKQMAVVFRELRNIEKKVHDSVRELDVTIVMPVVDEALAVLRATYDHSQIHTYLNEVRESIAEHLDRFRAQAPIPPSEDEEEPREDPFTEFRVNVLVDNSETTHVPIILETNPKYKTVFGTVEREFEHGGVWRTDFTKIKAGSLLRADGGYLVLNALDTLSEPGVWQDLKRTLRTGLVDIQTYEPTFSVAATGMKPEAIPINVKVIMIGDTDIYHLLYSRDEDFKKIFKIRADFDFEMKRNGSAITQYMRFVKMLCDDEKLLPFDASAIAQVIEFGVRLAGNQKKISTRFNLIADVVREASYWGGMDKSEGKSQKSKIKNQKEKTKSAPPRELVTGAHVERAISERIYRVKLVEEKIQEMIDDGSIMIDTKGSVVGQVNGLSVYDVGEHAFGKPARITARTALGRSGVINIEREADMSGPTHNKGVAILSGYFRSCFAQEKPLVMDASITFEQSYGGVDGDSASSTEIYAILSSLSGIPIRQDLAVTGSVNQKGDIQPIGGVNLKIEGFFDVCKARGFTGTQGVLIPSQNVPELMLREDVYDAVMKKRFHVYSVETIEQGIEILTGVKAGGRRKKGGKRERGNERGGNVSKRASVYESGTVFATADGKLWQYALKWKEFEGK
jgi:predicted ATP-dependent protease